MSLVFSDPPGQGGIIQLIERNCAFNPGDISSNTVLLQQFTADINIALDKAWSLIIPASGSWELDDTNFNDYPIISTNLVSGQRDYSFTIDGSGNIILDIYRVTVANPTGVFAEIYPVNQEQTTAKSGNAVDTTSFIDGKNATGTPTRYDKTGNGIFLDVIPNYNSTNGLKVYINREASYFTSSATTKKPGFAGIFHEYLALRPSYQYSFRKNLANTGSLRAEMESMERAMQDYYSDRQKDVPRRLIANVEDTQ